MNRIRFKINGESYNLEESQITADTTLYEYLHYHVGLFGTKAMCREGGCGACIVSLTKTNPLTHEKSTLAVNACLVFVLSLDGCEVTTVEGVGNRRDGYHPLQQRLASFNGTQCGFCTPSWIMSMYSITAGGTKQLTSKAIENSFASNMCRCTAYRPILDAFKTFASDADKELKLRITDMEDLDKCPCPNKGLRKCSLTSDDEWCVIEEGVEKQLLEVPVKNSIWYKAYCVEDVFTIFNQKGLKDYRFVYGNTGKGVYPSNFEKHILIDISQIASLKEVQLDVNLVVGAGLTLNEVMDLFATWAQKDDFRYLEVFRKHLDLVAHVPVRNIGSLGGNLAMKNKHKDFASDVFMLLATVGAFICMTNTSRDVKESCVTDFLNSDLTGYIITRIKLPPLSKQYLLKTYKIMPRAQNAHAIMNAGFLFHVESNNIVKFSNIAYGAVAPQFVYANKTANAIQGLPLFDNETLRKALSRLSDEVIPLEVVGEASAYSKKMIALGLFYKALLNLAPADKVGSRYRSGGEVFERGVSTAKQTFNTDKALWPLNEPLSKLDALQQCAGEGIYTDDVVSSPRDAHVALVLSTICKGELDKIDGSEALKMPGVIAVFTAKDIPGTNTFTPLKVVWQEYEEEILATSKISYYGQPIAVVAATTRKLALQAAEKVKVTYKNVATKLVLTLEDALNAPDAKARVIEAYTLEAQEKGTDTKKVIKGSFNVPSQYHYYMEPQTCRASMSDFGIDITVATQWMDLIQVAVADMLGITENKVNITVGRVGGSYGGKASRSSQFACACSLVAHKLNRPARLVLPIVDNMQAVGKRQPCRFDYEVGVNDDGLIQFMDLKYYSDNGYSINDAASGSIGPKIAEGLYNAIRISMKGYTVLTDKAQNTWCRAPGSTEATAIMEHLIERIAIATGKSPIDVRLVNVSPKHEQIKSMVSGYIADEQYHERLAAVQKFNAANAWVKRSLKLALIAFDLDYFNNFAVTISVYHADGTVAISHGGIEMGQGINTKTAQVCAYTLKISLDKVTVKASNNFVSPNNHVTNGSYTSESVALATIKACNELTTRLQPIKSKMNNPTWEELVKRAYESGVNLQTSYMYDQMVDNIPGYSIYGLACAELEFDVLTGTHQLLRVDVVEDTGQSLSPSIDVGQVEGAFLMGVGMWTSEELIYDRDTGRLRTDRTWTYKVPGAKDIPLDFRIDFKRSSPNANGVLRSKATGEPALNLSYVVGLALHDVIMHARKEYGYKDKEWVEMKTPYSVQNIMAAIQPNTNMFKFN